MIKKISPSIIALLLAVSLFSCVPTRQYQELQNKQANCLDELEMQKEKNLELSESNNELKGKYDVLKGKFDNILSDTIALSRRLQSARERLSRVEKSNRDLMDQLAGMQAGNARETKALLEQIRKAQNDLQLREDEVLALEKQMDARKRKLDALQAELGKRDQRLRELESALRRKDEAVKALKDKVMSALTGFEGNGLSISTRNGKVYVSMDEKLLFRSGSYTVDQRGVQALGQLAKVLAQNKDINVMIEGHTDNVPYNGSGVLKDNWDLSVKRATSIVRIIIKNKGVAPNRLTVAGRSKYVPVETNSSSAGRSKNRRTEIILTPKLDELFKILESN
ncbi:OmpA family protein [Marinifilum flexuosum]|uniref:Chemotaxis protein MotB n=1 Tax=Marinifilum flexuosum TaxID=1117708 RepID=A0A419X6E7_9BACT|nr:OmpA family protein [Marinifilum flexuosum]RKE03301.1 chemotaxis protein MotB [Marinifilum flexuosum]